MRFKTFYTCLILLLCSYLSVSSHKSSRTKEIKKLTKILESLIIRSDQLKNKILNFHSIITSPEIQTAIEKIISDDLEADQELIKKILATLPEFKKKLES